MDKRKFNKGTKGNKGGRKPKVEEQVLIEKLTPIEAIAFKALENGIKDGEGWAVKLFFDYRFGKPKETKDIHIKEYPQIEINHIGDYTSIPEAITVDE